MQKDIPIPNIGGNTNLTVIEVAVKEGAIITVDDVVLTLETDKASLEIPATVSGTVVKVLVKVGDKVNSGMPMLVVDCVEDLAAKTMVVDEVASAAKPQQNQQSMPVMPPKPQLLPITRALAQTNVTHNENIYAGPLVRRMAYEFGVNLGLVTGSGRNGRILVEDVKIYIQNALNQSTNTNAGNVVQCLPLPEIDFAEFGAVEATKLSRIKKIAGSNLHRNWVTIPHVTHFEMADITEMEEFRAQHAEIAQKSDCKLTPLVFFMKAVVKSLQKFPHFNASLAYNGEELILKKYFHLGIAVDTPNGLVVPVIRNVEQKGLIELALELKNISAIARNGKLTMNDMRGGCFTISSLGGIGGTGFTPIINAPEVAILGITKAQLMPVCRDNAIVTRLMVPLALSYDHRVIDGADAARFMVFLREALSDIREILL